MPRNEQPPDGIDWSLTTWEGSRREQLRRWAVLPLERIILALEEMEDLTERFRQMRESEKFSAPQSGQTLLPASARLDRGQSSDRTPLEPPLPGADNDPHELEAENSALARPPTGATSPHPSEPDSVERSREHGVRRGSSGPETADDGTRAPGHATRYVETRLGILSYAELAPHLARNVLALELRIENGEFAQAALADALLLDFHHVVCGDLVPQLAGWRRTDVTVGEHTPPDFFRVPALAREYGLDLQARLSATVAAVDDMLLETLAFAEGRLLTLHPFPDFNGRVTRVWLREILRRLDLPPVRLAPTVESSRDEYLTAVRAADRNDWRALKDVWRGRFEEGPI